MCVDLRTHKLKCDSNNTIALLYVFQRFCSVPCVQTVLLVFLVLMSVLLVFNLCSFRAEILFHPWSSRASFVLCCALVLSQCSAAYLACYSAFVVLSALCFLSALFRAPVFL
jgi:hypothetical protein